MRFYPSYANNPLDQNGFDNFCALRPNFPRNDEAARQELENALRLICQMLGERPGHFTSERYRQAWERLVEKHPAWKDPAPKADTCPICQTIAFSFRPAVCPHGAKPQPATKLAEAPSGEPSAPLSPSPAEQPVTPTPIGADDFDDELTAELLAAKPEAVKSSQPEPEAVKESPEPPQPLPEPEAPSVESVGASTTPRAAKPKVAEPQPEPQTTEAMPPQEEPIFVAQCRTYLNLGWRIIPIDPIAGKPVKKPTRTGWQNIQLTEADLAREFGPNVNVGVLLGDVSGGLTDIDVDAENIDHRTGELARRIVPRHLPHTAAFGRKTNPVSHHFYIAPGLTSEKFYDIGENKNKPLLEIRANLAGGKANQTVLPPSTHEDTGEIISWDATGGHGLTEIDPDELGGRVGVAAAAILLAKYYPPEHARNMPTLLLSGALAKKGWDLDFALDFFESVWDAVQEPKVGDRENEVRHSYATLAAGKEVAGLSKLGGCLPVELVERLVDYLGLRDVEEENDEIEVSKWPEPPTPEAFPGLAGDFVKLWEPHTEADPAALLAQFLTFFGSAVGRQPFFAAGGDDHTTNLELCLVGPTSYGSKGQSYGCVKHTFDKVAPPDLGSIINEARGLSSGEGLIAAVRDPRSEPNKKGEIVVVDEGIFDKRLLVFESEFASPLRRMCKEGNTLSEVMRQAWDSGNLGTMTRNAPLRATGAHISLIAHVTRADLALYLNDVSTVNGFANRFIFIATKRARILPNPGRPLSTALAEFAKRLAKAVAFGKQVAEMRRSPEAEAYWEPLYAKLTAPRTGRQHNAVVARARAHALRLSMIYALLDGSATIELSHLKSAEALWDYAERTSRFVFGDSLGDRVAKQILDLLREAGAAGLMTREITHQISQKKQVPDALRLLLENEQVLVSEDRTGETAGRKGQRWTIR